MSAAWSKQVSAVGVTWAFVLVAFSSHAVAQGSPPSPPSLVTESLVVDVDVQDALALTRASITVKNVDNVSRELHLDVPLSYSAVLTNLTLSTHNKTWYGVVRESATAEAQYNASKARGEDAVLISSAGRGLLSLELNVAAKGFVRLNASYAEVLDLAKGVFEYAFPLGSFDGPIGSLRFHADIQAIHPWSRLEATGGSAAPQEANNRSATWDVAASGETPTGDLRIRITPSAVGYTSSLLLSERGRDAAFVASLIPPGFGGTAVPLDVVFVLDHSGSMSGDKILQAKAALDTVLGQLRAADRFGLVVFDDTIDAWKPTLVPATSANVASGRGWVAEVAADGSTDIEGGVARALQVLGTQESASLPTVVLITDGLPTAGITVHREIIASIDSKNTRDARVHVVGIGFDQDNAFLGELAAANRGFYLAIGAEGDVRGDLEDFYQKISTPMLRDLTVTFEGLNASDVHPVPLPDLYRGSNLVIAGRANTSNLPAEIVVIVSGRDATAAQTYRVRLATAQVAIEPEAERLWARQKANSLERYIQLNEGYVNVTKSKADLLLLGLEHQVATLVTSWVIVSPVELVPTPVGDDQASGPYLPVAGAPPAAPPFFRMPGGNQVGAPAPGAPPPPAGDQDSATPGVGAWALVVVLALCAMVLRRSRP